MERAHVRFLQKERDHAHLAFPANCQWQRKYVLGPYKNADGSFPDERKPCPSRTVPKLGCPRESQSAFRELQKKNKIWPSRGMDQGILAIDLVATEQRQPIVGFDLQGTAPKAVPENEGTGGCNYVWLSGLAARAHQPPPDPKFDNSILSESIASDPFVTKRARRLDSS